MRVRQRFAGKKRHHGRGGVLPLLSAKLALEGGRDKPRRLLPVLRAEGQAKSQEADGLRMPRAFAVLRSISG